MNDKKNLLTDFLLIFVSILWGINTTIMKLGYNYIPPLAYNTLRLFLAAIFSWVIVFLSGSYKKVDKKDIKKILQVTILGFSVLQLTIALGMNSTTAGNASLILAMVPISVVIINKIFKIEDISPQNIIAIIFSFIGVMFIVVGSGKSFSLGGNNLKGILLLLIAQFSFAYYMVFSKELLEKYSAYQVTAYAASVSALSLLLFSFKSIKEINLLSIPAAGWLSSLYAAFFGLCIGNILWSYGIKKVGSVKTAIYNNLPPVFTIITAYALLGELFSIIQFFGAAAIFTGLYITRIKVKNLRFKILISKNKDI